MKHFFVAAAIFTILFLKISKGQVHSDVRADSVHESLNDSMDLANNFYYYEDSLSYLFSSDTLNMDINEIIADNPSDSIYGSWDTESTHYPKNDFSTKSDTTLIPLVDNVTYFYCHPINGIVTSHFGPRRWRYHYGTDINLDKGDTIRAMFDGKVRITKRSRSYGYVVVLRHFNGLESLYAHLSKLLIDSNQLVKAGDPIALGGSTGRSTGPHLHFEVRYLGAPVNPEDIIDFQNHKLLKDTLYLSKYHFRYLEDIKKLKAAKFHKIRSGDTLSGLAVKYHTTVTKICRLNGISRNTILRLGRRIRVR